MPLRRLLLVLSVTALGHSYKHACTTPSACKSVQACAHDHEYGFLQNQVLFKCGGGYVCCPEPSNLTATTTIPRRTPAGPFTTEGPHRTSTTAASWEQTQRTRRTTRKHRVTTTPAARLPKTTTPSWLEEWEGVYSESDSDHTTASPAASPQPLSNENCLQNHRNRHLLPDLCGMSVLSNKIVGGQDAAVGEFPWMVLIGFTGYNGVVGYVCGGTLISDRYVLTAAHCLHREDAVLSRVRLGEFDLDTEKDCSGEECYQPAVDIAVERLIPHEHYSNRTYRNDIALLRLQQSALELGRATIIPICLPLDQPGLNLTEGYKYEAAGWGLTGWKEDALSNVLKKTNLAGVSEGACNAVVCPGARPRQAFCPVSPAQLCVQGSRKRDVCKGDSGGPLMTSDRAPTVQVGVTSFKTTEVCGEENVPSIFTRVDHYTKWILDNMAP